MTSVETGLIFLNLAQLAFWAFTVHRLVDKVMSGNYYNYEQARGINNIAPVKVSEINPDMFEDLNGVKGIHPGF